MSHYMGHALLFFVGFFLSSSALAEHKPRSGPALSLSAYLDQVSNRHLGVKAAEQTALAAKAYSGEAKVNYVPTFVANGLASSEGRSNPLQSGDHFSSRNYSLGLSQQTSIGLSGKLSYAYSSIEFPNVPGYSAGYGQLDLTQSLLRNFAGRETRAQVALIEANALAKSFSQSFVGKSLTLEAESSYWRLALAREMVQVQNDAVDRAQKIAGWTNRRAKLQLTDKAESLQASTNLQSRRLDLKNARDDERSAAQAFNSSRGVLSDKVEESLIDLVPDLVARLRAPERRQKRDDVAAAEQQARATAANAQLAREKDKPTVELYGTALLTDPNAPPAQIAAILPPSARPSTSVGVRVSMPLDLATLKKARDGYDAEAQASDWQFKRKTFEEERDWNELAAKFQEAKERFKLYADLERAQKEKLDYERDRQQRGRSTLQQVLIFENDFESAQLGRIRVLADLLTLNAQLKLFGASNESR